MTEIPYSDELHWRFSKYVEFGGFFDCWNWIGATSRNHKYQWGVISIRNKTYKSSRVSWMLNRGPIPDGLHVLHRCDNGLCINPGHLFLGTPGDNVEDMDRKGRRVTVAHSGERHVNSKLTAAQVHEARDFIGPARILAERFHVTPEQINNIRRGRQRKVD